MELAQHLTSHWKHSLPSKSPLPHPSMNLSSQLAAFSISGKIPEMPPAYHFSSLQLKIAYSISSLVGGSSICTLSDLFLVPSSTDTSKSLWTLRIFDKCVFYLRFCSSCVLQGLPYLSFTIADLKETNPSNHNECLLYISTKSFLHVTPSESQ